MLSSRKRITMGNCRSQFSQYWYSAQWWSDIAIYPTFVTYHSTTTALPSYSGAVRKYPFVYEVKHDWIGICKHGYTGRYGGGYIERGAGLSITPTDNPLFFPLQNFLAFHCCRKHELKLTRWLMSRRAKCSVPEQGNLLRKLFLQ
jgi:hypothetical protein